MVSFSLREAEARDARSAARLQVACWRVAYAGYVSAGYLASMSVEAGSLMWLRSLADPTQAGAHVAEDDEGSVVGWTAFGLNRNDLGLDTGEVYGLYVDPECWRQGIGSGLLLAAEDRLAGAGFQRAVLWTLAAHEASRRFFEDRGWEFDATLEQHASGASVVRYGRTLRDPGKRRTPA